MLKEFTAQMVTIHTWHRRLEASCNGLAADLGEPMTALQRPMSTRGAELAQMVLPTWEPHSVSRSSEPWETVKAGSQALLHEDSIAPVPSPSMHDIHGHNHRDSFGLGVAHHESSWHQGAFCSVHPPVLVP